MRNPGALADLLAGAASGSRLRHFPLQHWRGALAKLGVLADGEFGIATDGVGGPALYAGLAGVNYLLGASGGAATGYLFGWPVSWNPASTTQVIVGFPNANYPLSVARDKADSTFLTLAAGSTITVDTQVHGAAGGDDSFAAAGSSPLFNLSGTAVALASGTFVGWRTSFGKRALTGTWTLSGATLSGTGTYATIELRLNDLVGVDAASKNWARVIAINSDTSVVLSASPSDPAGGAMSVCEQPVISIAGDTVNRPVDQFNDNGSTYPLVTVSSAGTVSNAVCTIGNASPTGTGALAYLWLGYGGSGLTAFFSTQRTTPYGITGYNTNVRLLTAIPVSGATVQPFATIGPFGSSPKPNNGRVPLFTQRANGNSSLDFPSLVGYRAYEIELENVVPSSQADFYMRFSTDNGATFGTANYYSGNEYATSVGTNGQFSPQNNGITFVIATALGTNSDLGYCGRLTLFPGSPSTKPFFEGTSTWYQGSSGDTIVTNSGGIYNVNGPLNAVRFLFSAGNVNSGTITVYGVP